MPTILEDYFDFSEPEEIRVQGHRVWLHHVLKAYLQYDMTLEQLCERFDTLNREKILACLLYYHCNQTEMDKYLTELEAEFRRQEKKSRQENAAIYERLLERKRLADAARRDSA